jgi:hypothetical protein
MLIYFARETEGRTRMTESGLSILKDLNDELKQLNRRNRPQSTLKGGRRRRKTQRRVRKTK